MPLHAVALAEGTAIACHEGDRAGSVVAVEADDYTAELTLFYSRLEGESAKTVAIPTAWARSITAERIVLECTPGDLATLPEYDSGAAETQIEPLQER